MLKNIYNQRITILNKLKSVDSPTKRDVWQKFVIDNAAWYTEATRDVKDSTVYISMLKKVLIPFNNAYVAYGKWKESDLRDSQYTVSVGDYIILGDVEEDLSTMPISEVISHYDAVCTIKYYGENHARFGATVQLEIEGV